MRGPACGRQCMRDVLQDGWRWRGGVALVRRCTKSSQNAAACAVALDAPAAEWDAWPVRRSAERVEAGIDRSRASNQMCEMRRLADTPVASWSMDSMLLPLVMPEQQLCFFVSQPPSRRYRITVAIGGVFEHVTLAPRCMVRCRRARWRRRVESRWVRAAGRSFGCACSFSASPALRMLPYFVGIWMVGCMCGIGVAVDGVVRASSTMLPSRRILMLGRLRRGLAASGRDSGAARTSMASYCLS